jgi:hypothetical protein
MQLREIAHVRTGDKGNYVTISLIAWKASDFPLLEERITADKVTGLYSAFVDRPVDRYVIPGLLALNFVLHRSDTMSVTRSLALDIHGKCLGSALLGMEI